MLNKNFLLAGLYSTIQLGKRGLKIVAEAASFKFTAKDGTTLVPIQVADATLDSEAVTLRQLNSKGGIQVTGQIDGNSPPAVTNGEIYVVTTSGGTYTEGELYRGENGVWVQVPTPDGFVMVPADDITGGTLEFLGNHVYNYDADTDTWVDNGPAADITNVVRVIEKELAAETTITIQNGNPAFLIGQYPAGCTILDAIFKANADFNDNEDLEFDGKISTSELDVLQIMDGSSDVQFQKNRHKPAGAINAYYEVAYDDALVLVGTIDGNSPPVVVDGAYRICTVTGGVFTQKTVYLGVGGVWTAQAVSNDDIIIPLNLGDDYTVGATLPANNKAAQWANGTNTWDATSEDQVVDPRNGGFTLEYSL